MVPTSSPAIDSGVDHRRLDVLVSKKLLGFFEVAWIGIQDIFRAEMSELMRSQEQCRPALRAYRSIR